ncbi:ABC transporter permease [Ornithinimicrobium sp. W1679]|uniref:ABC transporter permease n=1 Tax=Ornithinimicrobium sp. W1679 TaxID=3418770 RepID=UPI003CE8FCF7
MTGTRALVALALRRSRWYYLAWVVGLAVLAPATAAAYETVVGGLAGAGALDVMAANPTMRAMLGPPHDLTTPGGFTVWRVGTFVATLAGLMAVLGVVRVTRADEEEGRTELLRSGVVGRHAPLTAALVVGLLAVGVLGLLLTVGMVLVGEPVGGSVAFGVGTALTGAVFVGVGAVTAQLTASARAARGLGLAVLGGAYLLRAVADAAADGSTVQALRWASPVEWMALARPYAEERWAVLLLPLVLTALLVVGAFALEERRDHGSGVYAVRPGPAGAAPGLRSPVGLAWRLHRPGVLGWVLGLSVFALGMGSLTGSFERMIADLPQFEVVLRRMGGGADQLVDAFYVAMLGLVSVLIAVLVVLVWQRLAAEERLGHAELVLSTAVRRTRFALSHLVVAVVVGLGTSALFGALLGAPYAVETGSGDVVTRATGASLALAPGALLVLGVAVALHGWVPRAGWLVWLLLGWSLFMVWVGTTLGLPGWLTALTPWEPLPTLPVEEMAWTPVLATTLAAVALMAVGLAGYRRRDVGTG